MADENKTTVTYEATEHLKGLQRALNEKVEEAGKLSKELEAPDCKDRERKLGLFTETMAKAKELRAQVSAEQELIETRAWLNSSKDGGIRPAGDQAIDKRNLTPPDKRFGSFGDYLIAVIAADSRGGRVDPRLESRAIDGASTVIPSQGGFLVQPEDGGVLMREVYAQGGLFSRCRRVELGPGSNGMKFRLIDETSRVTGSRHGGIRVYQRSDGGTVTDSKLKWRDWKCDLEETMGVTYLTNELMQDATALGGYVTGSFGEAFNFHMDEMIVRGTGVGQPLGVLNSGALVSIAKEGSQTTYTLNMQNVLKMWAQMWNPGVGRAVWIYNQDVIPQLMNLNSIATGAGWPMYIPVGNGVSPLAASPNVVAGTLLGSPAIRSEHCDTIGLKGDIMFLDLNEYMIIQKGNVAADSSIHVKFLENEMTLRFILRWNGAPLWSTYMTPFKGTKYVSPFISLDARTS